MGLSQSVESTETDLRLREMHSSTLLDHSSVATLKAVTDAVQNSISARPTTWADVEHFLLLFGKVDILVREAFPGSRVVSDLAERTNRILFDKGFTPDNTLFSASVCPDEINHVLNNLSQMFTREWGECFQMGGLAGVPFSGKTGFGAFSAHIPNDGNLFILFAPHIGISPRGEFGLYTREGQGDTCGHACGAAVAAHNHIAAGGQVPDFTHLGQFPYDYQQQWIISRLALKMGVINASDNKMVELAKQMYYIIEDFILNIVSTENVPGALVLLGGVHINTPTEMEDFFWPIRFEIQRRGVPAEDLLWNLRSDLVKDVGLTGMGVTRLLVRSVSTKRDAASVEAAISPNGKSKFHTDFGALTEGFIAQPPLPPQP